MKKWLALALLAIMLLTTASAQEFTGTANGFGGPVTVTISVENGAITACDISAESETPSIGGQAANALETTIVENGAVEEYEGVNDSSHFGTDAVWNDPAYREANGFIDFNHDAYRAVIPASGNGVKTLMRGGVEFSEGLDFSKLGDMMGAGPEGAMPGSGGDRHPRRSCTRG